MKRLLLLITLSIAVCATFGQQVIRTTKSKYPAKIKTIANNISPAFMVDGKIALHALMSVSDAHMVKLEDALKVFATTGAARSGNWGKIRAPFTELARMNVPAVYWFALPDGTYWTLDQGKVNARLSDRKYFPHLLAGESVMCELVVSHSTSRNTAIIAVPVRGANDSIIGALGCSVHLDSLSALVRQELGGLGNDLFFYSFDAEPLVALHSDPTIIFIEPMKQEDEGLQQAFKEMLAGEEGTVHYVFRGVRRTVLYCKSPVTGWWYGLGKIEN
ncbi:MAG: cache domain-containing protein [Ginsengibacter sp.]